MSYKNWYVVQTKPRQEEILIDSSAEHPSWQEGDMVEVIDGPFYGLWGIFRKKDGMERASLLLEFLGH